MGLKDEEKDKLPVCNQVFLLFGSRGGLCVGFSMMDTPPEAPFDTIRICVRRKEDIEKMKDIGKCHREGIHLMMAEEAMRLGAALIQAAGFYKASVDQSLKEGFYADKWEAPKPNEGHHD